MACGYEEAEIWNYTPRKAAALLFVARRRQRRERAEAMIAQREAFGAKPGDFGKRVRKLVDE